MLALDIEKIDAARQKLGLSWNALAAAAGIKGPSMHAIKKGDTKRVFASTLYGIASALKVHPRDILKSRGGKAGADYDAQLLDLMSTLDIKNKQVLLATAEVLAKQQKS